MDYRPIDGCNSEHPDFFDNSNIELMAGSTRTN